MTLLGVLGGAVVLDASGTGPDAKLKLRFGDGMERVLVARFVRDLAD